MTPHVEILSETQHSILPLIGPFAYSHGFCLGGETGVALYLGHRRSVDFDWFTPAKLDDPLVLAEQLRQAGLPAENVQVAPGTLHALIEDVRVSFFEYPYPEIGEESIWPEYSLGLASLDDLACMKLAAVAQRGSRKDFIDLYAIALQHKSIQDMLGLYQRKYSTNDIAHVLVGLTYFDDAEEEPSPHMLCDTSWEEVKRQFELWARTLAG